MWYEIGHYARTEPVDSADATIASAHNTFAEAAQATAQACTELADLLAETSETDDPDRADTPRLG